MALVFAPALAACSLLLGEGFTDPNAVSLTDPDSSTADSPTNGGDGTTSSEGGPETDGSIQPTGDSGVDADAGRCPVAKVSFCDDFERANASDVKGAWQSTDVNAGGTLALKTVPTGNRVLATAVSALGGQAQMMKTFTEQPAKFHLELSLTVSSLASVGGVYVAGVGMANGGNPPTVIYLYVDDTNLYFVQQVANAVNYWSQALPITVGTEHRISIDLTFNGKLIVKVDGNTKIDQNAQTFLLAKPPNLYIGASSIDSTGDDGAFLIDDLVFTLD